MSKKLWDEDDYDFDDEELEAEDEILEEFDFDKIFAEGEKPKFHKSILDQPVGTYGEEE